MTSQRRRVTTLGLLLGTFLASLDVTVVATAMPHIAGDLSGVDLYAGVFAAFLLASTTGVPIYGKVADRWGRRPTYLFGMSLLLLGSALCAISPTMPLLIAARLVQGAGAGAILPMTVTVFGDLYSVPERARLQAVFSLVWGVSSLAGPALGAVLIASFGWPAVFWVNLPVGFVAAVLVGTALTEEVPRRVAPIDWAGAFSLAGAIIALLVGMALLKERTYGVALPLLAGSAALAYLFGRFERTAEDPIVPPSLVRDPVIRVATLTSIFLGGLLFTIIAFVPLLVRGVRGGSTFAAGAALIPLSFAWTAGSFLSGRLILRVGYRPTVRTGTFLAFIGTAGVAAGAAGVHALLVPASMVLGAGMGFAITSFNVVVQDRVPWSRRGAATALMVFSRNVGGTVVVSALGLLLSTLLAESLSRIPGAPAPEELVNPERWSFVASAVLEPAKDALRSTLAWVFFVGAASAGLAFLVALRFPHVRVGDRPEEPQAAAALSPAE